MAEFGEDLEKTISQPLAFAYGLLAVVLWLGSIVLGAIDIIVIRETAIALFVKFVVRDRTAGYFWGTGVAWVNWAAFILGAILVVYTIASGEYHSKHHRTRKSKQLFMWAFGIELALLSLGYLIQATVAAI